MDYNTCMRIKVNKGLLFAIFSIVFLVGGTWLAIQFAQGKFRVTTDGIIQGSGLLALSSDPKGAQIFLNDRLVSATDDTIYLEPGEYQVRINKDGYHSWQKNLLLEPELVTSANARLFPIAPSLSPLTFTGVANLLPSPDGQKVAFFVSNQTQEQKNGWYILDLNPQLPFTQSRSPKQILVEGTRYKSEDANLIWSPDSSEILFMTEDKDVIISISSTTQMDTAPDVAFRRRQILSLWEEEMYIRERQFLAEFPEPIIQIATTSANNVYFSPSKKMLLYTATTSARLAEDLVPALPAANSQSQERELQPNGIYVYDKEEDRNFRIGTDEELDNPSKFLLATDLYSPEPITYQASPSAFTRLQTATTSAELAGTFARYHSPLFTNAPQWFPDSKHLLFFKDQNIIIKEYDNTNEITLFSGPLHSDFFYPWPDGSSLIITASFTPNAPPNLYGVELKR